MIKDPRILSFLLLLFLALSGCNTNDVDREGGLFQFKNSYVGDNGAVGKIAYQLPNPHGEQLSGMELKTMEEPYGIILNYIGVENTDGIETNYKELALYNGTIILALVQNAEWVRFNFVEQEYRVTREKLNSLYEKDIRQFHNEEELSRVIQTHLEDDNTVIQFFN